MSPSILQLIVSLPVAAFGAWLCWIGLRNKGDTTTKIPSENAIGAGCGYSLFDLTSTRCPECGDRLKRAGAVYPITPKQRFWRACRRSGFYGFGSMLLIPLLSQLVALTGYSSDLTGLAPLALAWTIGIIFIIHTERRESRTLRAAAPKGWRPPNLKLTSHTDPDA